MNFFETLAANERRRFDADLPRTQQRLKEIDVKLRRAEYVAGEWLCYSMLLEDRTRRETRR